MPTDEQLMLFVYLLCFHPRVLNYLINGTGALSMDEQSVIDWINGINNKVIPAFKNMHDPKHTIFVSNLFQGMQRDFLMSMAELTRLENKSSLRLHLFGYGSPDDCPATASVLTIKGPAA